MLTAKDLVAIESLFDQALIRERSLNQERHDQVQERFALLEERIALLDHKTSERLAQLEERIERTETNLLTAFHAWASPAEQRMHTYREALRTLDLEIEAIASRVAKLEAARDLKPLH